MEKADKARAFSPGLKQVLNFSDDASITNNSLLSTTFSTGSNHSKPALQRLQKCRGDQFKSMVLLTKDGPQFTSNIDKPAKSKDSPIPLLGRIISKIHPQTETISEEVTNVVSHEPVESEDSTETTRKTLHPGGFLYVRWKTVLLIAVVIQMFVTPFLIAFRISHSFSLFWLLMYLPDAVYWFDILINFNTAVVIQDEHHAELVFETSKIAKVYIHSDFCLDLLSVFPFELIAVAINYNQLISFLRINRFIRLPILATYFKRQENNLLADTGTIRTHKFSIIIIMLTHFIACGWFLISCRTTLYEDAIGHCSEPGWASNIQLDYENIFEQYITSVYWTVTTMISVGYGDIIPRSAGEKVYALATMILGVFMFSFILGNIASSISHSDSKRRDFRQKLTSVKEYMNTNDIPKVLQDRVVDYYNFKWRQNKGHAVNMYEELPSAFRREVALEISRAVLEKVPLFRESPEDFLSLLALAMKPITVLPGDYVVKKGEMSHEMYFIQKGKVVVVSEDCEHVYATLESGSFFGELGILHSIRRTASVRASTYCDMFILNKEDFELVLKKYPKIATRIYDVAHDRFNWFKSELRKYIAEDGSYNDEALRALRIIFDAVDLDSNGSIDSDELELLTKRIGKPLLPTELEFLMQRMDTDGSGMIDFDEFIDGLKLLLQTTIDGSPERVNLQNECTEIVNKMETMRECIFYIVNVLGPKSGSEIEIMKDFFEENHSEYGIWDEFISGGQRLEDFNAVVKMTSDKLQALHLVQTEAKIGMDMGGISSVQRQAAGKSMEYRESSQCTTLLSEMNQGMESSLKSNLRSSRSSKVHLGNGLDFAIVTYKNEEQNFMIPDPRYTFAHLLSDALNWFNVPEKDHREYALVDSGKIAYISSTTVLKLLRRVQNSLVLHLVKKRDASDNDDSEISISLHDDTFNDTIGPCTTKLNQEPVRKSLENVLLGDDLRLIM